MSVDLRFSSTSSRVWPRGASAGGWATGSNSVSCLRWSPLTAPTVGSSSEAGELTLLASPGAMTTSSGVRTAEGPLAAVAATPLQPDEPGVTLPLPGAEPVGEAGMEKDGCRGCSCLEGIRVGILRYEGKAAAI